MESKEDTSARTSVVEPRGYPTVHRPNLIRRTNCCDLVRAYLIGGTFHGRLRGKRLDVMRATLEAGTAILR
jgi:hypothetical protein